MEYADRADAGRKLAAALAPYAEALRGDAALVLGVPRGGVVVAAEVAVALELPLDVAMVRKLGAPSNPELAIGAIAESGAVWLNHGLVERLHISDDWIDNVVRRESAELERRARRYRPSPLQLAGRVVVVVDDGVATGATLIAVLEAVRAATPARIVCAVPVAPPTAIPMLAQHCDEVVCPLQPRRFGAVGKWYRDFAQTTDRQVVSLLSAHR